jgi:hypothetical protein
MPFVVLAAAAFFLVGWPTPAMPAELSCILFPSGSLSRIECEHVQARQKREAEIEQSRSRRLAPPAQKATDYLCPDEKAIEIGNVEGTLGAEVRATFRNVTPRAFHEVIVGFALYNAQHRLVTTIETAVLPRTIAPGGTGTLAVVVPPPATLGWSCFRYEITGLAG